MSILQPTVPELPRECLGAHVLDVVRGFHVIGTRRYRERVPLHKANLRHLKKTQKQKKVDAS